MPGTGNKKASSNNSSEKLFLGASAEGSARDVSITTPQTPLAASLFCPRAASGAASACFQGWGPVLVGTSHTLKRGPHTGTRAHTEPKSHNRQGAVRLVCRYCCARLVCAGRVLLPLHTCIYYADIIRCCTTTPSPPSPSPTSAAVCWISFLGRSCARWLVVQSSQGARGEEFAAELRSFPASRRLLWGVRSLALPRRSSRAFVRAAVRLIQPGLLRQHPCAPHRGRIPCLPRRMSKQ